MELMLEAPGRVDLALAYFAMQSREPATLMEDAVLPATVESDIPQAPAALDVPVVPDGAVPAAADAVPEVVK